MTHRSKEKTAQPLPWRSDRELPLERVGSLIREQFPEVEAGRVVFLNEGWDSQAYLVDGKWIFRFPKRREVERSLATEIALLPLLERTLPLPIPSFRFVGRASPAFPYIFVGYERLPGEIARDVPRVPPSAPRSLGEFLGVLHAFPASEAERAGVPRGNGRDPARLIERVLERFERFRSVASPGLVRRGEAFVRSPAPAPFAGEAVLAHNDLNSEHILVESDRISGVIDWGDTAIGDPAVDLASAFYWRGEAFFRETLACYARPLDAGAAERARFVATCVGFYDTFYGVEAGRPEFVASGLTVLERELP
ncbi:phosphotransferase [bacterium]|nr:phosphotransferase [bacterium]